MNTGFPALPALRGEAAGRFPAQRHVRLSRCASTNDEARQRLLRGAPDGIVVLADAQDAGRGRLDREWFSPPGRNVHLSLGLRPALLAEQVPLLTLALAVAAHDAVTDVGVTVRIKWPNDLVVRNHGDEPARKLAGILCEATATPEGGLAVVAGLGINVNVTAGEWPAALRRIATSMRAECGAEVDRARVAAAVLECFAPLYARLERDGADGVLSAYRERLETVGRQVTVDLGARLVVGRAVEVGPGGELRVATANGTTETITAGDVGL